MSLEHTGNKILNNSFSQQLIDHATMPKNSGSFLAADGFARVTGPCGETIEIALKVNEGVIQGAVFQTDGCFFTVACADIATDMARGKSITDAGRVSQEKILDALGGLPDDHKHCALLASNTLKEAINDYLLFKREPWKRAYRK